MDKNDDRREEKLPVTAEVGSEGGSYADPTVQVATFEGSVPAGRGRGGASSSATQATRSWEITGGGASAPPLSEGIVRYATEPPHPPSATEGRRMSGIDWRVGLAGAAAGAAVALAVTRLRGSKREEPEPLVDCETVIITEI